MRGYSSYPFKGFGKGLNLSAKPDAIDPAECIDAMNVNFTDQGAIQQRGGYAKFTSSELTNRVDSLEAFYKSSGTKQLVAGCGTRLEALNTSGEVIASATGLSGGPWDFVRFGSPNEELIFAGNGTDTIRKWNGTAWSAPTATVNGEASKAMPKARYLCIFNAGNRMVATGFATTTGGPNAATSSPSHVYFSEEGAPETWKTAGTEANPNNSIQLTPGDGEAIQGAIAWREYVFIFKESKFFVFYGVSTDAAGNPVFNYRTVDTGIGCASPRTICADQNGVYFMSRTGVYRTSGQEPELLSDKLEPLFYNTPSSFYTGGVIAQANITNAAATIFNKRLYVSYPTSEANNRTLVYDPKLEWWALYDLPCSALAVFRSGSSQELFFGYASGTKDVGQHSVTYTSDAGTAISSYWRSGWFDLESPDVKTIRSAKVWGTGKVSMAIGHDFKNDVGKEVNLTLEETGTTKWGESTWGGGEWVVPAALVTDHYRKAVRGTTFSVYFANTTKDQEWSIHRNDLHERERMRPETGEA